MSTHSQLMEFSGVSGSFLSTSDQFKRPNRPCHFRALSNLTLVEFILTSCKLQRIFFLKSYLPELSFVFKCVIAAGYWLWCRQCLTHRHWRMLLLSSCLLPTLYRWSFSPKICCIALSLTSCGSWQNVQGYNTQNNLLSSISSWSHFSILFQWFILSLMSLCCALTDVLLPSPHPCNVFWLVEILL